MRALAREVAFKKIYEQLFGSSDDNLNEFFDMFNIKKQDDKDFATALVELYNEHREEIDELIKSKLVDYELDRVYKIDRAILSLAVVEIKYYKQNPDAVVINEAVNLAKKFGTEKSYAFVNAILKTIKES